MQLPPTPQQQQSHAQQQHATQQQQQLDACGLTQAGLEEYNIRANCYYDQTTFHHQKQASYAQSEGYHSYVSSSDSSSATPFLDKLRQESELLSRQSHHWSENDLSSVGSNSIAPSPIPLLARQCNSRSSSISGNINGNASHTHAHNHTHSHSHSHSHPQHRSSPNSSSNNNNNSSESTSSTETLKWLGSMSDISEASHATGYSAIAESVSSSSQLIVHSSRVLTPKRHHSESVLYLHDSETTTPAAAAATATATATTQQISEEDAVQPLRVQHRHSPSYPPVHSTLTLQRLQQLNSTQSSLDSITSAAASSLSQSTGDLKHRSSINVSISSSEAVVTIAPQPPPSKPQLSKSELFSCSAPNVASSECSDSYRSNHRLFPVSTYTEPVHSNTSHYVQHPKPQYSAKLPVITPAGAAVQPAWHSVAERINDFERSQPKFAYLEPSKTHRLSNPALKALQKNAVQSYVERQQAQAQQQQEEQQLLRPHNYQSLHVERKSLPNNLSPMLGSSGSSSPTPPPPPPRSRSLLSNVLRRSSSASDYAEFREPPQQQQQAQYAAKQPTGLRNISSAEKLSFNDCGMPPPPPPPRGRVVLPTRRGSSATEYAPMREKLLLQQAAALAHQQHHPQQHVRYERPPERPPKQPHLRVPSPELPPPPLGPELESGYTFDEPLPPPPPPEVLQAPAPPPANRRNSFAGASTRRLPSAAAAAVKVPPQVPKKPTSLRQLPHAKAPLSNGAKPTNLPTTSRKRPHHAPPILESIATTAAAAPPPPLLPRARPTPHAAAAAVDSIIANNLESNQQKRSNSKASYLPRQSLEKLNNTDPDHGIYKLTLTSNEDLVAHSKPNYGVTAAKLKLPNNLPDVLPLGVKLQQPVKPSSPTAAEQLVTLRYGSNNNLATKTTNSGTPTSAYAMIYGQQPQQQQPGQQRYSTPTLGHAYSQKSVGGGTQFTRSQSYDACQSQLDLKQAVHDLETTLEEVLPAPTPTPTPPRLSPAHSHSDCSLSSGSLDCSPVHAASDAHIFRAELISTTTTTPTPKPPPINRQESLRENIEKITQLQSQLMSAHICESTNLLSSYAKSIEPIKEQLSSSSTSPTPPTPTTPPPAVADASTDSLKLMQRSELVLLVNAPPSTADMACQTDELLDSELVASTRGSEEQPMRTTLQPRQRQAIELEYEQQALQLLQQLPPNSDNSNKLVEILTPKSQKPTTQYVSNLYNPNVPLRPAKRDVGTSTLMRIKGVAQNALQELQLVTVELQLCSDDTGNNLIKQQLDALIKQLNQKIAALKREQRTIGEECGANDQLGLELLAKLTEKVRPSEASKFRTYIDDVGHITSLLLSLSERLAQTDCSLEARTPHAISQQEQCTLEAKRQRLCEQLEEAQRLKADIDRRGSSIAALFGKHLSADLCADYDYFINMKAKLIADARDLADRIKGSEEQLSALSDTLFQSDC
ncbi:Shroom [Drosophila busckii]|uniref:Shroom n=2 Tax=Drosophila busckii TaxID=30019 RepID=A0A0M4EBD0_DROBS|nr:Shroom [Drosophila busckii]